MEWTARYNTGATVAFATAGRTRHGTGNLLCTRYPLFLLGLPPSRYSMPVYHGVQTADFGCELEFQPAKDYRTVGLHGPLAATAGKSPGWQKRVLLTFDDARGSFYDVALPAPRIFDARANRGTKLSLTFQMGSIRLQRGYESRSGDAGLPLPVLCRQRADWLPLVPGCDPCPPAGTIPDGTTFITD
jgi:hypothetical protein